MHRFLLLVCAGAIVCDPVLADTLTDWSLSPATTGIGDWTALLGAIASGAGYADDQDGGIRRLGVTGSLLALPRLRHEFEDGWVLGLHGALLAYHDALSGDSYGNRFFEKAYVSLDTEFGRVEAGQQDGAAWQLGVTGPKVDDQTSIDNANATFFRDPATGQSLTSLFPIRTAEFASENFAKFSYFSPRLFGVALGVSYAPNEAHGGLPFISSGDDVANRQANLLEGAANLTEDFGVVAATISGGLVLAHDAARTPGHEGLRDWSLGAEFDFDLEPVKLAAGGAWRQSNAYTFAIDDAFESGTTGALRLGATASYGAWIAGLEYANARADQQTSLPGLSETGWEPSVAYVVNANLQLTLGWQHLFFKRSEGVFYNGQPSVAMEAGFLHALLKV